MRSLPIAGVTVFAALLLTASHAQQSGGTSAGKITLNDLLIRMQSNFSDYLANVPNFFCDEQVDSSIEQRNYPTPEKTVTTSIFRLRRSTTAAGEDSFSESREIKTVNKVPAKGENLQGPAIFSGAFVNAMGVVSLEMMHCYDYQLEPHGQLGKTPAIIVDYVIQDSAVNDKSCPSFAQESGRAYIDPHDFHLMRTEMRVPDHVVLPGTHALWTWAVDYAPVTFDTKQFWMPRTIVSKAEANDRITVWSFAAKYSNYHKLTVTSHIVTDVDDANAKPQ